jgi:hypothetical protein
MYIQETGKLTKAGQGGALQNFRVAEFRQYRKPVASGRHQKHVQDVRHTSHLWQSTSLLPDLLLDLVNSSIF